MGAATVNIPERWRPWLDSGVTHVLGPLPWVDDFKRREAAVQGEGQLGFASEILPGPIAGQVSSPPSQAQALQNGAGGTASNPGQGRGADPAPPAPNRISRAAPEAKRILGSDGQAPVSHRPLPTDAWPEAWKTAWGKTGFARPFLWTYAQLGEDLLGTPAPERREALKKVLTTLNLGPVHNFWPFSEPDGQGGLRLQARLFREGLTYLAPKCVIFLGEEIIDGVTAPGPPELFKVISYLDAGVLCVHLPDICMLAAAPDLLDKMAALFRETLTHLI